MMKLQSTKIPRLSQSLANHLEGDVISIKNIVDLEDLCLLKVFSYVHNIREKIRLKRGKHGSVIKTDQSY